MPKTHYTSPKDIFTASPNGDKDYIIYWRKHSDRPPIAEFNVVTERVKVNITSLLASQLTDLSELVLHVLQNHGEQAEDEETPSF